MAEPLLPDAELEVLACLWKHGPLTARAIREKMQRYRPMTHSAVSTLLARVQKKGRVTRAKGPVGKAFVFRAAVPPGKTYRRIVGDLVERVFVGNGLELVSSLFDTHPPGPEEIEKLQALVDQLRQKHRNKEDRK